jgi:SAM-dependent methyltransferase
MNRVPAIDSGAPVGYAATRLGQVTDLADQDHDPVAAPRHRFYTDLASWWPLISAPEEYVEEAAFAASLLRGANPPTRTVLELGSGGGNNAFHLKNEFQLTLVDLSVDMLAVSRQLNPDCEHLRGDMRTLRLGRTFDAVFVHDAIDYMITEADLRLAASTAYEHCRPGGIAVFVPDDIAENFEPSTDHGGHDAPDGRAARYLSWSSDPDPTDTRTRADYAFLLRASDGSVEIAHDTHEFGLFPRARWLHVLADVGFRARSVAEVTSEDRAPREFFVGTRI